MSYFQQALERSDGKTLVLSNGSHSAGSPPDNIQKLLEALENNVLDPRFEEYHCYRDTPYLPASIEARNDEMLKPWVGASSFFGNFLGLSHVFRIITKDPAVIFELSEAIRKNVESEEYQRHAFEQYAGWYYAVTCEGHCLVSPQMADNIRTGKFPPAERYRHHPDIMSTAKLLNPRFEGPVGRRQ